MNIVITKLMTALTFGSFLLASSAMAQDYKPGTCSLWNTLPTSSKAIWVSAFVDAVNLTLDFTPTTPQEDGIISHKIFGKRNPSKSMILQKIDLGCEANPNQNIINAIS
jgi:hypothetical protein